MPSPRTDIGENTKQAIVAVCMAVVILAAFAGVVLIDGEFKKTARTPASNTDWLESAAPTMGQP